MELRLAVFASGSGTNFQAIVDAIETGKLRAEIALLVADRAGIGAIERAKAAWVPVAIMSPAEFSGENAFAEGLLAELEMRNCNFIVLAGFLKKLPQRMVAHFRNRILNIHPALLPSFGGQGMYGRRVHQAVLDYGCKVSGATIHLVDADYDTGPPVLQRCVPVLDDDTAESLAARVLQVEHELLPAVLQLFADDRVIIRDRHVRILQHTGS